MSKRRKKKKINRVCIRAIFFVLAMMAIVLSVMTAQLKEKQKEYEARIEVLQGKVAEAEDYGQKLEEEELYVHTKQYVEKIAREKLGLVKENELLIKPNSY